MIRVQVERSRAGAITAFTINGHAYYGNPGHDIVCAGVSAVSVGTVNSIEKLTGVSLPNEMREGLLKVRIPEGMDEGVNAHIQLLLESMVVMIETIEETYGSYIAMKQITKR
ncbi:MAG: ribosomal protein [Paenibacillus sp.]|jgi:uncharacterized protein YsxB (DUF464 family)|nr:ribosomal protein [Paenibacillus sp.]